jgi:hypothetical protein
MIKYTDTKEFFSTPVFTYEVDTSLIREELMKKLPTIGRLSKTDTTWNQGLSSEVYYTNFGTPTTISSFEGVLKELKSSLAGSGLYFEAGAYWVAAYRQGAGHELHIHKDNLLGFGNFSGILHMSNIGKTVFITNSPSSSSNQEELESAEGLLSLFPATLPHSVPSHGVTEEWRYIIAFNAAIYNQEEMRDYGLDI